MANWTDLSAAFGYGTKLTSAQMQQLRDNIQAAFEKASGAPELAASYVKQAMLATSSGSVSTTGTANLTLPGGQYGFYPQINTSGSSSSAQIAFQATNTSYVTNISLTLPQLSLDIILKYILFLKPKASQIQCIKTDGSEATSLIG